MPEPTETPTKPARKRASRKPKGEQPEGVIVVRYDPAFPLADLQPYYRNPNRGDVETIRRSLRKTGQYRAIVVNVGSHTGRANEVLAGNHTFAAAKAEGRSTMACEFVDVDEQTAARIVAIDNRAAEKAKRDADVLAELLGSMNDLEGTG